MQSRDGSGESEAVVVYEILLHGEGELGRWGDAGGLAGSTP